MTTQPKATDPEPAIEEILTDPIVELMMRSDGVSLEEVALLLLRLAVSRQLAQEAVPVLAA